MRIYELAKELGLENKAVLDLCEQLGIHGKSSHSNSLSEEESDKIRRSVIRRAVSGKEQGVREVATQAGVMTEQRMGNVIRRRKKTEEELQEAAAESARVIDLEQARATVSSAPTPSAPPSHEIEKASRQEALARADALFRAPDVGSTDVVEPAKADEEILDEAAVEPSETTSVVSAEASKESVTSTVSASAVTEPSLTTEVKRRSDLRGAKVLGKIELPIKTTPLRKTVEAPASKAQGAAGVEAPATEEDEEGRRGVRGKAKRAREGAAPETSDADSPKRKAKKKQILRKDDLVDYDGDRDVWRTRKEKKSKKDRSDANADGEPRTLVKSIKIDTEVSVGELAKVMSVKVAEVMTHLMNLGVKATINQMVDIDTAVLVASEFGVTVVNTSKNEEGMLAQIKTDTDAGNQDLRPPVVTVMGHVDHGKTSLLDAIRKTQVTAGEAGGITQHIGAYNVVLASGGSVTFLDTPGHEAFTAMRSRGAKVTDIVVLVVAADDGVMPQTVEAINHAKAANVPIIVAVNKIDKPGANMDRIKTQMSEHGLVPEDWGGDTILVGVSAHTKEGIDILLENLHAQAEILELKANPDRPALGAVIESKVDRGRGPVMTVLVQNGTLRKGDIFLSGGVSGRVRALVKEDGTVVNEAGPSIPVEVLGASAAPLAGDDFFVLSTEAEARQIAQTRQMQIRHKELAKRGITGTSMGFPMTLESFSDMVTAGAARELPIIVKADVQGSVEAVTEALNQLAAEEVKARVIHKGVGAITENDVQLAVASKALLIGFNVRADSRAAPLAESEGIRILYSRIIYELIENVQSALKGMLAPKFEEQTLGRVEVRETFKVPKMGMVAGSYVVDGTVQRGALVRLLRDNRVIYEGKMGSLRRFKDDVREVQAGYECGIGIEGYSDIKQGDVIEVYKIQEIPVQ